MTRPLAPMVRVLVSVPVSDEPAPSVVVWLTLRFSPYESLVVVLPFEKVELPLSIVVPRSVIVLVGESSPVSYRLSKAFSRR